jgi:hypothetical protein
MFFWKKHKTTITCGARLSRAEGAVICTAINNCTFDGSTKDAMQQAVMECADSVHVCDCSGQAEATKAVSEPASSIPWQKPSYACAVREDMLNYDG